MTICCEYYKSSFTCVIAVSQLYHEATLLVKRGLQPSTQQTYSSAENQYLQFCSIHGLCPLPASEEVLLLYVTYLYKRNLKHGTIKVYLAAARSLHIRNSYIFPTECHKLNLALRAVANDSPPPKRKLPITYDLLERMYKLHGFAYNDLVYWTAICVGFFGCLRAAEFTVKDDFDPQYNLTINDVSFSSENDVPYVTLYLKRTKTGGGVSVVIGCSKTKVCAYCMLQKLLEARKIFQSNHPALFIFSNGQPLNKQLLVRHLRFCLSCLGLQPDMYSGHSLRAGSATTAGTKQFQSWEVKSLGRWASQCYNIYIRSTSHIAQFSQRLAQKH